MKPSIATVLNIVALYAIALVLLVAFAMQFTFGELPCPLCLLQRALFCAVAAGPILNLRHGPRPSHYALSILAALVGAAVSMRQILLHILPGDPGYGMPLFGIHYYTWAFVLFVTIVVLATLMLMFDRQFEPSAPSIEPRGARLAVWLVIALVAANVVSTFAICGLKECPDNPVRYELFVR